MYPCKNRYELPTLTLVAGASKNLYFNLFSKSGSKFDASEFKASFSISKTNASTALKTIDMTMEGKSKNTLKAAIAPQDTLDLMAGKYIYQIWVVSNSGEAEEPKQGELYIEKNIDEDFISKLG